VILVAGTESFRALMCTTHASQWVASVGGRQSMAEEALTSLARFSPDC
jgi:hypothetical protein